MESTDLTCLLMQPDVLQKIHINLSNILKSNAQKHHKLDGYIGMNWGHWCKQKQFFTYTSCRRTCPTCHSGNSWCCVCGRGRCAPSSTGKVGMARSRPPLAKERHKRRGHGAAVSAGEGRDRLRAWRVATSGRGLRSWTLPRWEQPHAPDVGRISLRRAAAPLFLEEPGQQLLWQHHLRRERRPVPLLISTARGVPCQSRLLQQWSSAAGLTCWRLLPRRRHR